MQTKSSYLYSVGNFVARLFALYMALAYIGGTVWFIEHISLKVLINVATIIALLCSIFIKDVLLSKEKSLRTTCYVIGVLGLVAEIVNTYILVWGPYGVGHIRTTNVLLFIVLVFFLYRISRSAKLDVRKKEIYPTESV